MMIKKQVFICLIALVLLIGTVNGWAEYNGNVTVPHWFNTTSEEASQICIDHGKTYTGDYIGVGMYWSDWTHESHIGANADYDVLLGAPQLTPNTSWVTHYVTCSGSSVYTIKYYNYGLTSLFTVNADFNASQTEGIPGIEISFIDNSTGTPDNWNWSVSPSAGTSFWPDSTSQNVNIFFNKEGNYSISHGITNTSSGSSDIETKTDYIQIVNSTEMWKSHVVARDRFSGYAILNASISMKDVENSSWQNTTASGGTGSITTLSNHHLDLYATADGYTGDSLIGVPAVNEGYYSLLLSPTGTGQGNVSAGNITLYVTVQDQALPHNSIEGATVQAAYGSTTQEGTSNAAGSASFAVPNNTAIYVTGFKTGYVTGTQVVNSGTGSGGSSMVTVVLYLSKDTVTVTPTTSLSPGTTAAPTKDPYPCDADHPEYCQRKQTEMANDLIAVGPELMGFFILATIVGVVKMMGKK